MAISTSILVALALVGSVFCAEPTPYQTLPPAPKYSHGVFTSPDTTNNQIYAEGSQMNITWETDYNAVNIDLIKSLDFNSKVTIASMLAHIPFTVTARDLGEEGLTVSAAATSQKWVTYNIECIDKQCNLSHHFLLTSAYGDPNQNGAWVWSGAFWIKPSSGSTSTSSTSSPSSSSSTTTTAAASASASSPVSPSPSPANNNLAIGVGVGVGVGGALLALAAGLLYYFRRRRNRQNGGAYSRGFPETPPFEYDAGSNAGMGYYSATEFSKHEHTAYPGDSYNKAPVEVPAVEHFPAPAVEVATSLRPTELYGSEPELTSK